MIVQIQMEMAVVQLEPLSQDGLELLETHRLQVFAQISEEMELSKLRLLGTEMMEELQQVMDVMPHVMLRLATLAH